jgi:hypothetical protein
MKALGFQPALRGSAESSQASISLPFRASSGEFGDDDIIFGDIPMKNLSILEQ